VEWENVADFAPNFCTVLERILLSAKIVFKKGLRIPVIRKSFSYTQSLQIEAENSGSVSTRIVFKQGLRAGNSLNPDSPD